MKENKINIFYGYLRSKLKTIITGLVCLMIFIVIFFLYHVPAETTLYAAALCAFMLIAIAIPDYNKFIQRHLALTRIKAQVGMGISDLPKIRDLLDKDYQEIINALHENQIQLTACKDNSLSEMIDYYTMWAHQIKTPISAMNLLLKEEDTEKNTHLLAELFKIEQYVEMVLSYLRLDSNATDFVIRQYSLVKIVRECIHKYARIFVSKKIKLTFDEEDLSVLTDEKWLSFVVEQIISNALKYTTQGDICITFDKDQTALMISDSGIGIHEEDLPRVFDKGFTGYNGRSGRKSTGLGLYLCKQILIKLSHTITITSTPGVGTTVRIGLDTYKNVRLPEEM